MDTPLDHHHFNSLVVTWANKKWFEYSGLPKSTRSDGGPQFLGKGFKTYSTDNGIQHKTSSPYNTESKGLAEAAVKNVKKLLVKCKKKGADFQVALAEFLQLLQGQRLLPCPHHVPQWDPELHPIAPSGQEPPC